MQQEYLFIKIDILNAPPPLHLGQTIYRASEVVGI